VYASFASRSVVCYMPRMGKSRRTVTYQGKAPRGGHSRLWAYGYADLARLLGTTEQALRARVARGWDPSDLGSVCREWARSGGPARVIPRG